MNGIIGKYHVSKNIAPTKDFTNSTTDSNSTLRVVIRLYNGATSLGEQNYNITTTGIQTIKSVIVTSTPITRIYIKHNGSRADIPILDLNVDFPNGQFWFTANYISINPTVAGGIQLSNMMLNRGSSALPYEPYSSEVWHDIPYTRLETATDIITDLPKTTYNDGTNATVAIKGNMQQSGTPTPTSPITPQKCGERTENLFDYKTMKGGKTGYYLDASGNEIQNGYWSITKYIPVDGTVFTLTRTIEGNAPAICLYDANGNYIAGVAYQGERVITISSNTNAAYIRFTYYIGDPLEDTSQTMLNIGSTAKPFEPYGYKLPIVSGNTTTNIYLSEPLRKIGDYADTIAADGTVTRQIKKIVFNGTENWQGADNTSSKYLADIVDYKVGNETICVSTHYNGTNNIVSGDTIPDNSACFYNAVYPRYFYLKGSAPTTLADFKTWLATQYSGGTPVIVWYVLGTPKTETITAPSIPTTSGGQTFDVDTTLKPSEVSLMYHGWHEHQPEQYVNGAWT